ncbi:YihY/virulence factor BrkB family protein [Candidatus Thiosymbion oneisti]|uniref:YihY/virulence factor BrkB family protein n=1 Tax=Candidatus Thiosymbion oneisti TaxID=589554 RepID=UPI00105E4F3F|nr:YihY/virulence factor BrkB family protein [Candidatus Thiosymbion oneisti]
MSLIKHWWRAFGTAGREPGRLARAGIFSIRLLAGIPGKFRDGKLHLQSTSLAYTTLLSLVPLLAVTFSVLKGFGVQNQLEPMLMQSLEPLGEKGAEIGRHILTYVSNLNFAVLGFFGIALLFWTVVSLLTRVEEAFNTIWHVPGVRSWTRRFSDYLSVALVGPVFIFAALGVTAIVFRSENIHRIVGIEPLDQLIVGLGRLAPYLLMCLAFASLYAFLTNCRVRLLPALAGGLFASVAWHGVAYLFARLVAGSSKYSAVYSGMAAAVLFIIWLNVGWLIVLVGAHIARYTQHPHLLRRHLDGPQVGQVHDQALALDVMAAIGRTHYFDESKWTLEALTAAGCYGSPDQVEQLLQSLRAGGLIVATNDEPETYLPARAIETIGLREILDVAHARGDKSARQAVVQAVTADLEQAVAGSLEGKTLKDLVVAAVAP